VVQSLETHFRAHAVEQKYVLGVQICVDYVV